LAPVQNNDKFSVLQVTLFSPPEVTMDWIVCGSEHRHSSWIELDWISKIVDRVGLDLLAKWTHVQLASEFCCLTHLFWFLPGSRYCNSHQKESIVATWTRVML